ncbi:MAG: hypothetical protein VKK97_04030, partial [Synechococcaceae cyanobacterium]|nr:hypothetical protein [Synechococcaceae cyanobacterium]
MGEFHGKRYWYPTPGHGLQKIGVCQVLGGVWAVCWINHHGSRVRVKTSNLPVLASPDLAQRYLDEWAAKRKLKE